jgi:hypothetical protein
LSAGRTVNPTPATAGDALEGDAITGWCKDLGDGQREAPAIELYREARRFNDQVVAEAANALADPTSSSREADKAYRTIERVCSSRGVELPAA